MKSFHLSLCACLCLFSLAACGRLGDKKLDLPPTPLLSASSSWGLVKSSYVRLKEGPDLASVDRAALRDGTEVEIVGREFDKGGGALWLKVRTLESKGEASVEGWVGEESLDIYATREQAEKAQSSKPGN